MPSSGNESISSRKTREPIDPNEEAATESMAAFVCDVGILALNLKIRTCFTWSERVCLKMVEVLNAYPHSFPQVNALRNDLANHAKPDTKSRERSPGLKLPVRTAPRPLRKRLAPKDRQRLIADYLAGALQKELATRYGIGLSSVKTVLREAGAKKYTARV
ncbi:hypothetical protein [Glycomyces sp. MUSA5-2]|uniref:hypothetical protein n=1 Tax=Glycomyces sp. MUSA5-2 TaxID=2053002 RepID=UPI0030095015